MAGSSPLTPEAHLRPVEIPLRSYRLLLLYCPDYMTSSPAHTSRASARAAQTPPSEVMQKVSSLEGEGARVMRDLNGEVLDSSRSLGMTREWWGRDIIGE